MGRNTWYAKSSAKEHNNNNPQLSGWGLLCSDIGGVPDLGALAEDGNGLIADLQDKVALLERPFAIGTYEGKRLGRELEGDGLHLTWLKDNLSEVAQTLVVGHDRGNEVARIQKYSFLTGTTTSVLDIDADGKNIICREPCLVNLQVGILERGITEAVAEGPLSTFRLAYSNVV